MAGAKTPMRGKRTGVKSSVPVYRSRSGVTGKGEHMTNETRTGVVLQFARRRGAHGSSLARLHALGQTEGFGRQAFASQRGLDSVGDGRRKPNGPLADGLSSDPDLSGGLRRSAPEKFDSGCFVHASFNHSCTPDATIVAEVVGTLAPMDSFGERLKHALETRKAERKALASVLGISVQAISKIINTDSSMNAQNTAKAARYLQVSWYWLATGEGDMENVEYPVAKQEALALANLRAINTLDPSTAERIGGELARIADGLRAQDALTPKTRELPPPVSADGPTSADLIVKPTRGRKTA